MTAVCYINAEKMYKLDALGFLAGKKTIRSFMEVQSCFLPTLWMHH